MKAEGERGDQVSGSSGNWGSDQVTKRLYEEGKATAASEQQGTGESEPKRSSSSLTSQHLPPFHMPLHGRVCRGVLRCRLPLLLWFLQAGCGGWVLAGPPA